VTALLRNQLAQDSGPVVLRLWATEDAPGTAELTTGFLLVEETVEEGVPGSGTEQVNSTLQEPIEPPPEGIYYLALTREEPESDTGSSAPVFARNSLRFPLPEIPTESDIRRRVAAAIPCGALFVPFSLATFAGLCLMKMSRCRTRRRTTD
jgi:hypothetical protein